MRLVTLIASPMCRSCVYIPVTPLSTGALYAVGLFGSQVLGTLCQTKADYLMFVAGLRVKNALVGAIFRQAAHLNNAGKQKTTNGQVINLVATDSQMVWTDRLPCVVHVSYVYMCVCMYVCMHVCVHVSMHVSMNPCNLFLLVCMSSSFRPPDSCGPSLVESISRLVVC
jgi:hypothetical protein